MMDLRDALIEAQEEGTKADFEKTKKKITDLKAKLKGRPVLEGYNAVIDVPADGHVDLKLELTELKE